MLNVPEINAPIDVIPAGYEHIITATYSNNELQLELVSSKTESPQRGVILASKLFQPTFPRFLFTDGKRSFSLTHLQVLYLLLAHRFKQFASLKNGSPFLGLIAQDMENLNKWNTYNTPNTYNKRKRIENSFAIIQYERLADLTKDLPAVLFNAPVKFPKNLSLSSVGAAERSNVVTLHSGDKQMFRAPAYRETEKGFYCIFKSGQNVPARMQSHVINDAYELASPCSSVIQQDNVLTPNGIVPKDNTLRPAIVVFHPFGDTDRFIAGEGEASEAFASTLVRVSSYIEEHFASTIEVGTYEGDTQIGTTLLGDPVVLRGYKEVEIIDIISVGQAKRVVYEAIREAGNARVISNTGLKCVTKTVKDTGTVAFEGLAPIDVDLVIGMNSNKGKSNAIVLAQACLATHLGLYTPKKNGLLNSLDEEEINTAASKLPPFTYSKHENVYVGLVYMQFTELCSTYTAMREQAFAFEAGRVIHDNSPELYKYIWDNYLEEDKIAAAKELFSIHTQAHAPLPSYDATEAREIFTRDHLVLNTVQQFPSDSILLDEEWNKNGFYVCGIRIPSAASLSLFSGGLKTGEMIYHINLVNASKIILEILTKGKVSDYTLERYKKGIKDTLYSSQRLVQSFIKPKIPGIGMKQVTLASLPPNTVLITNDRIYNKLKAVSLKGAPAITTTELELLLLAAEGDERAIFEKLKEDAPTALVVRNPALWSQQVIKVKVWDRKMFDIHLALLGKATARSKASSLGSDLKLELGIESPLAPHRNDDVMFVHYGVMRASHSDSDGDTLPLFMLDYKGQQLLKDFEVRNTTEAESLWHDAYVEKERSSGEELLAFGSSRSKQAPSLGLSEEHKYKLHFVTNEDYAKYLSNAVVCKTLTGSSTLGLWAWSSILSLYRAYYDKHNGVYEKKGHKIALPPLSEQEAARLEFEMIRMVQDLVINGIKHVQNGSEDFAPYMLNNIGDKRYETTVRKSLRGFNVPEELINKLFFIVRFAKDNHAMLKATQNFFSLYNKGRFPKDSEALDYWSKEIVEHAYFGKLLAPLFDIVTGAEQEAELDAWLASL